MNHESPAKYIRIIAKNMNYYFNKKLEKYNIKSNQLQILHHLYKNKGVSQNELGEALMLDKTMITKILKGLVEEGYVEKRSGKEDKRRKELYITEKGYGLHDEVYELMEEVTDVLFKDFSSGEEEMVRKLLIKMTKNIYEAVQNSK